MADVFELVGRMRIDGADSVRSELEQTSEAGEQTQSRLSGALGKVGGIVKTVGKVAVAGVGVAAAGIASVTKSAVEAYANYEQLVGGVQKIFGSNAQKVVDNAAKAFKTAGMSANEYMETVTSFSASLVQGLGGDTKKATEYADTAIRDMSDNANTYGTNMQDIQNAYQGFAKQNYTMLDNLKLGYGGTQEEMIRLMNDSGVLEKKITSLDGVTFDQMIAGIHKIQENLNITGTTSKEAEGTIEGSLNSTKAAWNNLLVGMGDDTQDFNKLLGDFTDSASSFISNVTPRIKMIFDAIPQAVSAIAPQIPGILKAILPGLISGAVTLVAGLVSALPGILAALKDAVIAAIQAIIDQVAAQAPGLAAPLQSAFDGVQAIIGTLVSNFDKVVAVVGTLAAAFGTVSFLSFIGQGGSVIGVLGKLNAATLGAVAAKAKDVAITGALNLMYAKDAVVKAAATVKTVALATAQKGAAVAQRLVNAAMNANPIGILVTLIAALVAAFIALWNNNEDFRNFFINLWNEVQAVFQTFVTWLSEQLTNIGQWFTDTWNTVSSAVSTAVNAVSSVITGVFGAIVNAIRTYVNAWKTVIITVWNAIKTGVSTAVRAVKTVITTVFNAIRNTIKTIVNGWKNIITTVWSAIRTAVSTAVNAVKSVITTVFNAVKSTVSKVWNGIKSVTTSVWNGIKNTIKTVVNGIKSTVTSVFNGVKSTVSKVWNGIKTAITTPINSAKTAVSNAIGKIKSIVNGAKLSLPKFKLPHFNIDGGKLPWGIGGKGRAPKISVDWYAKGGIFDQPTLIPSLAGLKGVGEAGAEAVTPIDVLLGYVRTAVAEQNAGMTEQLQGIYALLSQYLPNAGHGQVVMDTGALVGQIAPSMDRRLGKIYKNQERGRS